MAGIQPSGTSTATQPAVKDLDLEESERVNEERKVGEVAKEIAVNKIEADAVPHEREDADAPRASHDASAAKGHEAGDDGGLETGVADPPSSSILGMSPFSGHDPVSHTNDDATASIHDTTPLQPSPAATQSSTESTQTHISIHPPPPPAPLKRFTAVNINKRFLEKTPSTAGASMGGSAHANHVSGAANTSASGQRRGASPSCMW